MALMRKELGMVNHWIIFSRETCSIVPSSAQHCSEHLGGFEFVRNRAEGSVLFQNLHDVCLADLSRFLIVAESFALPSCILEQFV